MVEVYFILMANGNDIQTSKHKVGEQHNANNNDNNKSLVRTRKKKQRHCVVQNKEVIELAQSASQPAYILLIYLQHNPLNESCCVVQQQQRNE